MIGIYTQKRIGIYTQKMIGISTQEKIKMSTQEKDLNIATTLRSIETHP